MATRHLVPACAYCLRVRDQDGHWHSPEPPLTSAERDRCSHGICPECYVNVVLPELRAIEALTGRSAP